MKKILAAIAVLIATFVSIVAFSTASLATPSDAIPCEPGTYSSTGYYSTTDNITCVPAPAGSYVANPGATAPTLCSAGTFQSNAMSISCLPSPPGMYAPAGSVTAILCPDGTYSGMGQGACTPASLGYFATASDRTQQLPCEAGTYQPQTGQSLCLPAPAGSYVAAPAAAAVTSCAEGSFQPAERSIQCLPAPVGMYVAQPGAVSATSCPSGFTTAGIGSTSADACSISTRVAVPAPTVTPSPTPTPTESGTPATPVVVIAQPKLTQSIVSLRIPTKVKVGGRLVIARKLASGLLATVKVSGQCSAATSAKHVVVSAARKVGDCKISLVNQGSNKYLPLAATVKVHVIR